jgi:DNA-binding transcriptional LysR family regulator
MERTDHLRSFVAAAELKSFASAARKLGSSRDQVSKHISALEFELQTPLFVRSTRQVALTGAGELLLTKVREILRLLDEALASVSELQARVSGTLRVNAPMSFGQRYLAPLLPEFHRTYPDVMLRLDLDDSFVDPARSGADITLRIAHLPEHLDLVARPLATAPRHLVAAPAYLERWGAPPHPAAVQQHACLHYGDVEAGTPWQFERGDERITVAPKGPLCSNNGDLLLECAIAGLGLTVLPQFLLGEAVADGRLRYVLDDWRVVPDIGVFALYAPASRTMPAVRAFLAHVEQRLHL